MALIVLDASVVIAFFDDTDRHHEAALDALTNHREDAFALPASAYAECLVGPLRRGSAAAATIESAVADRAFDVVPVDREIARRAAELRARHTGLGLPDALVLATGDVIDANAVLTADRTWTRYSKRAKVI